MKTKLILIEGIPGSGKTTLARRTEKFLKDKGVKAKCYNEGMIHPADLAWLAYLTLEEYNKLLLEHEQYADVLRKNSRIEDDMVVVAFTYLGIRRNENELIKYLQGKEIFDGKLSSKEFLNINLKRWKNFCKQALSDDYVYIFECAFLQNHINELLAYNDVTTDYIIDYAKKLISTVEKLNPTLIYLDQSNVRAKIESVAKERTAPEGIPDWIDLVIDFTQNSSYGQRNNLKGFDGAVKFFADRAHIEREVIKHLPIDTFIINNPARDWDDIFNKISSYVWSRLT